MIAFVVYLVLLAGLAWLLAGAVLKSWTMSYRTAETVLPSGPVAGDGPVIGRAAVEYRPAAGPPDAGMVPCVSPDGVSFWSAPEVLKVDPVHVGATEDWSPKHAAAEAAAGMLPLDDVDEWLAARVREFEHELSRISCRTVSLVKGETCRTLDDELDAFITGSQQIHAYRQLRIGSTGDYGPREHMQLEAMVA